MVALGVAVALAALYVISRRRDKRMLRNGLFLVGTIAAAIIGVIELAQPLVPDLELAIFAALLLFPMALVVLAGFLIVNGILVIRREGRSAAHLLSLVAGLALLALLGAGLADIFRDVHYGVVGNALLVLAFLLFNYFGAVFVVFLVYSAVYGRSRHANPDVVIVLGAGLIDGRVTPLLRSRLDRALGLYRAGRELGRAPLLIPSGGQGADEPRSEGSAMAEYLLEQGADPSDVVPETASTNTRQNLLLSREVQQAAGRTGTVLAVTNGYHVLRTAILARSIDSDAQVVGSPTAAYYVPSAFLREFLGILREHRLGHALGCVPFIAITVYLIFIRLP